MSVCVGRTGHLLHEYLEEAGLADGAQVAHDVAVREARVQLDLVVQRLQQPARATAELAAESQLKTLTSRTHAPAPATKHLYAYRYTRLRALTEAYLLALVHTYTPRH